MNINDSWASETQTKTTHEKWLQSMEARFQSQGVTFLSEITMEEYSRLTIPDKSGVELSKNLEEII